MELQLVSFEQAKALKELGFPQGWGCETHYCLESEGEYGYKMGDIISANAAHKNALDVISAPTLELVAKWLRDKKDLWIHMCKPNRDNSKWSSSVTGISRRLWEPCSEYNSYEEALSEGIDKAIEILKINNNGTKESII